MNPEVSVIIVTHNSELVLNRCIDGIENQIGMVSQVVLVDCGSENISYLEELSKRTDYVVHHVENIGYAAANNFGLTFVRKASDFILFINPDTFLTPTCISESLRIMSERPEIGILSGMLKGYNLNENKESGKLDSTGVFRTWYGRWYDRGQGEPEGMEYKKEEYVPALCGAYMFCRLATLDQELPELFDESFFMYKEDIDLCLRLRKKKWKLLYTPVIQAYHCRGWLTNRSSIDKSIRLLAARNEIKLNMKHFSPYVLWALAKYVLVRLGNV